MRTRATSVDNGSPARGIEQSRFLSVWEALADERPQSKDRHLIDVTDQEKTVNSLMAHWRETVIDLDQSSPLILDSLAQQSPDQPALIAAEQVLSFGSLNSRSNQLARYLSKNGVVVETVVGICLQPGPELLIAIIAVLKAGGAFCLLDPDHPEQSFAGASPLGLILGSTQRSQSLGSKALIALAEVAEVINQESDAKIQSQIFADNLAYVGGPVETDIPLMMSHRAINVACSRLDHSVGKCGDGGMVVFDTSCSSEDVVEWLWALSIGNCLVILPGADPKESLDQLSALRLQTRTKPLEFSLFYFDGKEGASTRDKYRLLIEGAKFADQNGFTAIWTPERHFHEFGGLYPNPAVTSAALATITENVQLRAGSVVLPLNNPLRVTEEWSAVDNLSHGRVGISFATGWHANDFALAPENYANRKAAMVQGIDMVRRLWRGESLPVANGLGNLVNTKTYPPPIQRELKYWVTCSGNPETFVLAGELGGGVLTHLLGQSVEELQTKIKIYRDSLISSGHDESTAHVTLMLHTFIGDDLSTVRETVRQPFSEYLLSSLSLIQKQLENSSTSIPWRKAPLKDGRDIGKVELGELTEAEKAELASFGFERYFSSAALFGTTESCSGFLEQLQAAGVDEIACLIDFGVDAESALASLSRLKIIKDRCHAGSRLTEAQRQLAGANITMLQCSSSRLKEIAACDVMKSVEVILLSPGPSLYETTKESLSPTAKFVNQSTRDGHLEWINNDGRKVLSDSITSGKCYVLDEDLRPVGVQTIGDLYVADDGVARGYFGVSEQAIRFRPNPFNGRGQRMWSTGLKARYLTNGEIESSINDHNQVQSFTAELAEGHLNYWRRQVGVSESKVRASERRNSFIDQSFELSQYVFDQLDDYSRQSGVSLFLLLGTAFQALLRRYSGLEEISLGTCLATSVGDEFDQNTLVLRTRVKGDPDFSQLLEEMRKVAADGLVHHEFSYRELVEKLGLENALFEHAFIYLRESPTSAELSTLKSTPEFAGCKLVLVVWRQDETIAGVFSRDADEYMANVSVPSHYQTLLENIVEDRQQPISQLPLISMEESARLSLDFNAAL